MLQCTGGIQIYTVSLGGKNGMLVEVAAGFGGRAVGEFRPVSRFVVNQDPNNRQEVLLQLQGSGLLTQNIQGGGKTMLSDLIQMVMVHGVPRRIAPQIWYAQFLFTCDGVIYNLMVLHVAEKAALAVAAHGCAIPPAVEVEDQIHLRLPGKVQDVFKLLFQLRIADLHKLDFYTDCYGEVLQICKIVPYFAHFRQVGIPVRISGAGETETDLHGFQIMCLNIVKVCVQINICKMNGSANQPKCNPVAFL